MKIENLQVNQVIPNYKELCTILDIKYYKGGNAKESQFNELERFIKYHKEGHKIIVDEIYKVPLPPNNNITKYIPLIEKLILHIIITESDDENKFYVPKNQLLKMLKMINSEYSKMKYKQMQLSKRYNVPKETIIDFYTTSDDLLQRNLEKALNSLQNQSLIFWNHVLSVSEIIVPDEDKMVSEMLIVHRDYEDEYGDIERVPEVLVTRYREHRQATEEETSYILEIERELLNEMKCESISEMIQKGKVKEFYNTIYDQLFKERKIEYYYKSYMLIYNIKHIIQKYEDADVFLLDDESKYLYSKALNTEVMKNINDNAEKRKASEKYQLRGTESYIKDTKRLTKKLIYVEDRKLHD